jgi:hypothetical protein
MSYPKIALDTIDSAQSNKEVTANNLFEAESPAALFGCDAANTAALTFGYYGGVMYVNGAITAVASGTVLLSASATNYVESTSAGVVSTNTTGFTAGRIPLYTIATLTATIDTVNPARAWVNPKYIQQKASVSITTANVTLTAAEARCDLIVLSGTLTGNRDLIVPNSGTWTIDDNTSGAFTVTVKTSGGSGVTTTQGSAGVFVADGADVIAAAGAGGSSNSFSTIAVSGQSNVVADSSTDTLTLVAGTNITITTNATTDSITINSSGGGGSGITLGTQQSASGTAIDFTSIPSGTKLIRIMVKGFSSNGSNNYIVQIGDSGGIETSTYLGACTWASSSGNSGTTANSSGFLFFNSVNSTLETWGIITLALMDSASNTWAESGNIAANINAGTYFSALSGGIKALSAELDRVRITTVGGTDTLDAGTINIQYE